MEKNILNFLTTLVLAFAVQAVQALKCSVWLFLRSGTSKLRDVAVVAAALFFSTALTARQGTYYPVPDVKDVTQAGFAFAGESEDIQTRYPHTYQIYKELKTNQDGNFNLSSLLIKRAEGISNPAINLMPELVNLKKDHQALMSVLVITGETVLTEKYDAYTKTFIRLRGDVMLFDWKNKQIVVNYPVSVELFDAKYVSQIPSEAEIAGHIKELLYGDGSASLFSQYVRRMSGAVIPAPGTRTLQVNSVVIAPEALGMFPEKLRNDALLQDMLCDDFTSALSARANVSILPAKAGTAVDVMYLQLEDRNDPIEIKPGSGDYLFDISLLKYVKKEHQRTKAEVRHIYGVLVKLDFYEPLSDEHFFDAELKNAEYKDSLLKDKSGDDFPAYWDTLRRLFVKYADAVKSEDKSWIETAASVPDIAGKLRKTRKTIDSTR